MKNKLSRVKVT